MTSVTSVPFDKRGDLMHYPVEYPDAPIDWRTNEEFRATLTYSGYSRGRSAAYFHFKDAKGRDYPMFLTDVDKCIPSMVEGKISGTWIVSKRGQNYGIRKAPQRREEAGDG